MSVLGLNLSSTQGDKVYREHFKSLLCTTPTIDLRDCPDLGPILFALASVLNGATFEGTKRLRIKESDRCKTMESELSKLGARVQVFENSVVVSGKASAPCVPLYGHNDHRIVMALCVILTLYGGEIEGCEAVSKSYPNFFEDLGKIGIGYEVIE